MSNNHHNLKSILILVLGLLASSTVLAQKISVNSATPAVGDQGTISLDVEIAGNGFDDTVTDVDFLLPCATEPCTDTGGIVVEEFTVQGRKKILARISLVEAQLADFDIRVRASRGRGGKGTTLFKVQLKPTGNETTTTCNEAYFDKLPGQAGPCNAVGGGECILVLGNPERIKKMKTDCETTETIVIPDTGTLTSDGSPETEADRKTMTAILPFTGSAVITNAGHRASAIRMNVGVAAGISMGCAGQLQSAISFVLDNSKTPPPSAPDNASYFHVFAVTVRSEAGPFCKAIEMTRTDSYANTTNDWKTRVEDSFVTDGSYSNTGIYFEGFVQQQEINPPKVTGNTIGTPDCQAGNAATGLYFGPLSPRLDGSDSQALIEDNAIDMSNGDCSLTTGIVLSGNTAAPTSGNINNSDIIGAHYGVVIDSNVDSVNLKGNTLTGNGVAGDGSAGICSGISVGTKGKPNKISGFDQKVMIPCP